MNSKKILIINYYYPPINNGGVQRTYSFMKYLPCLGYDTCIVTTGSFGTIDDEEKNRVYRFPDTGVEYTDSDKNSGLMKYVFRVFRRALLYFGIITDGKYYWEKNVLKGIDSIMSSNRFDAVIASYPTPANLEIGEYVHDRYSIPLIVDYRDGLLFDQFPQFKTNSIVFRQRIKSLEKRICKKASLLLTVNEPMLEYYSENYPDVESVAVTNGFDDEETIYEKPLELPDGINVVYTGAISKSRVVYSMDELNRIFSNLCSCSKDINFIFIGDYTDDEKKLFESFENVKVFNRQSHQTVLATQRIADALLLISGPEGSTSGKLYEYMFANKPILNIGGKKGIAELINGSDFGCTFAPEEKESINDFLRKLSDGKSAFRYEKKEMFTRRKQCEYLAYCLQRYVI